MKFTNSNSGAHGVTRPTLNEDPEQRAAQDKGEHLGAAWLMIIAIVFGGLAAAALAAGSIGVIVAGVWDWATRFESCRRCDRFIRLPVILTRNSKPKYGLCPRCKEGKAAVCRAMMKLF